MEIYENEIKWFTQFQGQVQGPFDSGYLQSTIDRLDVAQLEQTLVWRRGFAEWLKASKIQVGEHTMTMTSTLAAATVSMPALPTDETVVKNKKVSPENQILNQGAFYRVQVNFVDQPLMSKNDLLNLISKQEDVSVVAIQDPKSKEWKEVYAFPDIIEKLGLSRRKDPRVPILAQLTGKSNRHESFFARIITISEGGVGLTEVYDLKIGDDVEGQMTSPHFFQGVNFKAEVVYAGLDGYIGLKFNQISEESQASIIDYIKKFGRTATGQNQP